MPKLPKPTRGRPPLAHPRTLLHLRVDYETGKRLDAECKRRGVCLGRLIDSLAESLP